MNDSKEQMDRIARIERLKRGNWQFGHDGMHGGIGTDDCPIELHHHCDIFCKRPSKLELIEAGIDPKEFEIKSRA